ncbi:zinc finger matrin-type protein 1-like [Uloborus diversus]|uniref:zinc finger matrin-type protein 1-like n=1 Tax=Uloborus diversus TaxID=327109 RepID=UPI0024096D74|nr:zinc finger matrin-type protein 1-like [Uloborus diversus]XP_054706378.1 zinc finger matrin-type protein 1-like [Uloborus diversus]
MAEGKKFSCEKNPEPITMEVSEKDSVINNSSDDDSDFDMRCDICDKSFSGVTPYEQHIKSRKHAKAAKRQRMKAKLMDAETDENTKVDIGKLASFEPYETCDPCEKEFGGPEAYQQHLTSKSHKRKLVEHAVLELVKEAGNVNMDLLKEMYKLSSVKHTVKSDSHAHNDISNESTEHVPGSAHDKSFDDLSEDTYECKPCGNVFTGLAPFIQHLKSKRHSKVEKEMEFYEMLKSNSTGRIKSLPMSEIGKLMSSLQIVDGIITCDLCKTSVSGYESAVSHVKGQRHSRKLENQKWKKEHKNKASIGEGDRRGEPSFSNQDTPLPKKSESEKSDTDEANENNSTNFKTDEKQLVGKETSL